MTTFKSSAAADIMMFDDVATRILVLMGKEATDQRRDHRRATSYRNCQA